MSIKQLPPQLANQIAAGEVIEGPVSVVKECVENAIDAQASQINIVLEKGGQSLVQIVDNGMGMDEQDLQKCILPHATSKIENYNDLHAIGTLGFRGEALASIASVAELSITSKTSSMAHAFQGHAKPTPSGKDIVWQITPASHLVGTTVRVEDLFYLTPARKKFMKSERADLKKIVEWVQKLALAQWDVGFNVVTADKTKVSLPVADTWERIQQRVANILGANFLKHSMYIDESASGLRLHGWISMPQYDRGQPDQQYTYVNNRFVKDKIMMKAVKQAYQKLLFHGRHAAYVLYLEIDPELVDVNVHPSKAEVRFADSRSIFQFIHTSLNKALREVPVYITEHTDTTQQADLVLKNVTSAEPEAIISKAPMQQPLAMESDIAVLERPISAPSLGDIKKSVLPAFKQSIPEYQLNPLLDPQKTQSFIQPEQTSLTQSSATHKKDLGQAIAQCHSRYILAQNNEGLVVIDQHAAHERILFEKLKANTLDNMAKQQLLMPLEVSFTAEEATQAATFIKSLQQFGFEAKVEAHKIHLLAVPTLLVKNDMATLIEQAWQTWLYEDGLSQPLDYMMDRLLANMACKAAIKVNHPLNITQMNAILRDMETIEFGGLCNHGRPAVSFFDLDTMDKWFLRGQ